MNKPNLFLVDGEVTQEHPAHVVTKQGFITAETSKPFRVVWSRLMSH